MTVILTILLVPLQFALGTGRVVCVSDHHVGYSCHEAEPGADRIADDIQEHDVAAECDNCVDMPVGNSRAVPLPAALQGLQFHSAVAQVWFGQLDPPQLWIPLRYAGSEEPSPFCARAFAVTISPRC